MRRTIIMMLAVVAIAAAGLHAEAVKERPVDVAVLRVTVYPDRAQIFRSAELRIEPGRQALLIENLPGGLSTSSLRGSALGDGVVLLGLSHREEQHLEAVAEDVAELERQLKDLQENQLAALDDRINTLSKLRDFLDRLSQTAAAESSQQIEHGGIDVAQWNGAFDFLGSRHTTINDSLRVLDQSRDSIQARVGIMAGELRKKRTTRQNTTVTARIEIEASHATTARIDLEYIIGDVRWTPLYDARLDEESGAMRLSYFAEVTQRTGEDWREVELTLSTAQPSLGAGPGYLNPWLLAERVPVYEMTPVATDIGKTITVEGHGDLLDKYIVGGQVALQPETIKQRPVQTVDALLTQVQGARISSEGEVSIRGGLAGEAAYVVDGRPIDAPLVSSSVLSTGAFPATFTVQQKETIPSGGDAVRTVIAEWTMTGETRLIARPRNRDGAFRIINFANQETAPLLPGRVAIFVGQHYLGQSDLISSMAPGEDFELPFGQDRQVEVKRDLLSQKHSRHGRNERLDQTIEIRLINRGLEARSITVEEPLPISRDDKIKIKLEDFEPQADSVDVRGKAYWTFDLVPDSEKVITVPYRVEYPGGTAIRGL